MKQAKFDEEMRIRVYLLIILALSFWYYLLCIFVDNDFFQSVMFFDVNDTFMDWFSCLVHFKGNPYAGEYGSNYPAMAVLFFKLCRFGIPEYMLEDGAEALRRFQSPWIVFLLHNGILTWMFSIAVSHKIKLKPWDRNLFFLVFLFSFPVMFALERGNIINLAFTLTIFFYSYYDDENKVLRELAFIALALAAGIKIYPAVFGLMLLKQRRFKECIRLAVYGILSFFGPFFCFGGWSAVKSFFKGVFSFSSNRATVTKEISDKIVASAHGGVEKLVSFLDMEVTPTTSVMSMDYGYNFSFKNITNVMQEILGSTISDMVTGAALLLISIMLLITAFKTRERWKELLSYTLLMVLIPSFSGAYVIMFLFIPFIEFLYDRADNRLRRKRPGMDYLYALIMLVILTPWALPKLRRFSEDIQPGPITGSYVVYFLCIIALTLLMLYEGLGCLTVKYRRKNRR